MATTLVSRAQTTWTGDRASGFGVATLASTGLGRFDVDWRARARRHDGWTTSPEELLAAAHATCFAMQLAEELAHMGYPPARLETAGEVTFDPSKGIVGIRLTVDADVDAIDDAGFHRALQAASSRSPISAALSGVQTDVVATLTHRLDESVRTPPQAPAPMLTAVLTPGFAPN